jgi:hypothetical protein
VEKLLHLMMDKKQRERDGQEGARARYVVKR